MSDMAVTEILRVPDALEIDADWLTAALNRAGIAAEVQSFTQTATGTGQVGDTYRYILEYVGTAPPNAPKVLIGKHHSANAGSRSLARQLNLYRNEYMFYQNLASSARISVPYSYLVLNDDDDRFVMLLEDLAPARCSNQLEGITIDQARLAIVEAAKLHASHWGDARLIQTDWLNVPNLAQDLGTPEDLKAAWPQFCERYDGLIAAELMAVGSAFVERCEIWNRPRPSPRSLTHNDYRPDNFMFATSVGGKPISVLDWQTLSFCFGVLDVAYLLGGAFEGDSRRSAEALLLPEYHDTLCAEGVHDYSYDAFLRDYRHFTFAGMTITIVAAVIVKRTERGDALFREMFKRHSSHVLDHDMLGILK